MTRGGEGATRRRSAAPPGPAHPSAHRSGGLPEVVWLHVGLHKTGTTHLQNLMRVNRGVLRSQGVFVSGGADEPVPAFAVSDLQGRRRGAGSDPRIAGSWRRLVDAVNGCGLRAGVISDERLGLSTPRQVSEAVRAFPRSDVRVLVTARDLARSVVSGWQDEIKNGQTWTWQEFVSSVRDPAHRGENPNRGFWRRHDLLATCAAWEAEVGADHVTVVTVPPSGSPPDVLVERFMGVLGADPAEFRQDEVWANANVNPAMTEVMRRLNERLSGRLDPLQQDQVVKFTLGRVVPTGSAPRPTLPAGELSWVRARAREFTAAISERGYPLIGDLDDLLPRPVAGGRRPDDVTDAQLADAVVGALVALGERVAGLRR